MTRHTIRVRSFGAKQNGPGFDLVAGHIGREWAGGHPQIIPTGQADPRFPHRTLAGGRSCILTVPS